MAQDKIFNAASLCANRRENYSLESFFPECYNECIEDNYMTIKRSYVAELEYLILNNLLPVYEKYYKKIGKPIPYDELPHDLLKKVYVKKQLPALLKPKEIQT